MWQSEFLFANSDAYQRLAADAPDGAPLKASVRPHSRTPAPILSLARCDSVNTLSWFPNFAFSASLLSVLILAFLNFRARDCSHALGKGAEFCEFRDWRLV